MSQKTELFTTTVERTSDPTKDMNEMPIMKKLKPEP
jgi:hypothetical protein